MSKANEPAFPLIFGQGNSDGGQITAEGGLTKRELIAALALQGCLACPDESLSGESFSVEFQALTAVRAADALLAELEKPAHAGKSGLIDAAPDLLEALKAVAPAIPPSDATCHVGISEQEDCLHCSRILAARRAIAKAEGQEEESPVSNGRSPT